MCNSFSEILTSCGVGILPAQIWAGKMPTPQDFQLKLHTAFPTCCLKLLEVCFADRACLDIFENRDQVIAHANHGVLAALNNI